MTFLAPNAPILGNVTLPFPVYILLMVPTYHMSLVNLRKYGAELSHKKQKELIY